VPASFDLGDSPDSPCAHNESASEAWTYNVVPCQKVPWQGKRHEEDEEDRFNPKTRENQSFFRQPLCVFVRLLRGELGVVRQKP
jgi:hypothetical protein